jgi:hypothetical protein
MIQALVATNNTDYIQVASHGHISLDSFPFGGCNTVMVCVSPSTNVKAVSNYTAMSCLL